jgi:hypothetical protein
MTAGRVVATATVRKRFKISCKVRYHYERGEDGLLADLYLDQIDPQTADDALADEARETLTCNDVERAIREMGGSDADHAGHPGGVPVVRSGLA